MDRNEACQPPRLLLAGEEDRVVDEAKRLNSAVWNRGDSDDRSVIDGGYGFSSFPRTSS